MSERNIETAMQQINDLRVAEAGKISTAEWKEAWKRSMYFEPDLSGPKPPEEEPVETTEEE